MNPPIPFADPAAVHRAVGTEVFVGAWLEIDQERIDRFAQATGDFQWIHVDRIRATAESPFGGPIAHGFLTLALLGKYYEDFLGEALPFCDMGVNYGLNRVRFTAAVPVGARVRGRFVLSRVEDIPAGLQMSFTVTVEIEGSSRPALVAESIVRRMLRA